jgi:hypothetical protein
MAAAADGESVPLADVEIELAEPRFDRRPIPLVDIAGPTLDDVLMSTEHVRNARVSVEVPICVFGRDRDQFYYGLLVPGEVVDYLRAMGGGTRTRPTATRWPSSRTRSRTSRTAPPG